MSVISVSTENGNSAEASLPPLGTGSGSSPSAGQGANRLWIVTADDGQRRFGPAARADLLAWWEEGRILLDMAVQDAETGEMSTVAEAIRPPLLLEDRQVHTYIHPHEAEMGFLRTVRLDAHRPPEVIKVPGGLFPPGQTRIKYRVNAGLRSADAKRRANLVLFISIHPPGKGPVAQPSDILPATRLQPKPGEMTPERMPPLRLIVGNGTAPPPPSGDAANEAAMKRGDTPPAPIRPPDVKYIQLAAAQAATGGDFAMQLTDGRTVTFRVPPGITNGQQLLYPQLGTLSSDGQPADLLLVVQVA